MSKKFTVAIVGATGLVGESIIELLKTRRFPVDDLHLLASEQSAGKNYRFNNKQVSVKVLDDFDFSPVDIAFFSAGKALSLEFVTTACRSNTWVIDNTSAYRLTANIPLVVPEVNGHDIQLHAEDTIIANPNCSTIQMVVAVKPLMDQFGLSAINVSTYQSVSGAGRSAVHELAAQTAGLLNAKPVEPRQFPTQIAFNVIPQIDELEADSGYSREELKMIYETRKILADDSISINATCVRVPVFFGHGLALNLTLNQAVDRQQVVDALHQAPGIKVIDETTGNKVPYPTPVDHGSQTDAVYVGRIRCDLSDPHRVNLWVVADNIRKGAALNSVQIAEQLLHLGLS